MTSSSICMFHVLLLSPSGLERVLFAVKFSLDGAVILGLLDLGGAFLAVGWE